MRKVKFSKYDWIKIAVKYGALGALVVAAFVVPHLSTAQTIKTTKVAARKLAKKIPMYNWGQDVIYPPNVNYPYSYGSCNLGVSQTALNSIFYRANGGAASTIDIVDNTNSISTTTTFPLFNIQRGFVAASDLGGNFAYIRTTNSKVINFTANSGQTWTEINLQTFDANALPILRDGQMTFGADGVLYVFYFISGGTLKLLKVTPTGATTTQVINPSPSSIICSYDTCQVDVARTYNHVVAVFKPGNTWDGVDQYGSQTTYTMPKIVTINTTTGATALGFIGADPDSIGACSATNDARMLITSDGDRVYVARGSCISPGVYGRLISDLGSVNPSGGFVDNNGSCNLNPGSTDPLTNLGCIPGTELYPHMATPTAGTDTIRQFEARYRAPGYAGVPEVDVIIWTKDATGLPNNDTYERFRITNPNNAPGGIVHGPMEDITEDQMPGVDFFMQEANGGGANGLSSVLNATVASFGHGINDGQPSFYVECKSDTK